MAVTVELPSRSSSGTGSAIDLWGRSSVVPGTFGRSSTTAASSSVAVRIIDGAWASRRWVRTTTSAGSASSGEPSKDPDSGLTFVAVDDLPKEARQTLTLIDQGGPFPYSRDGVTFGNFEKILPKHDRGYYREYTVKTPGERDRGARRIVTGKGGERYYTDDHYKSLRPIAADGGAHGCLNFA